MPRIDPLQLLTCLQVLLAPNGGIKSTLEVKRIASLMQKFSKKLVSKCIYIQILKCSETELLGEFMEAEGWHMTHDWLQDAIQTQNWPLVQEILELFLLCPVDVNRLKSNNSPKLVKTLSKDGRSENVRILATKLVEQWLKVVKGEAIVLPSPHQLAAGLDHQSSSVGKLMADHQQQHHHHHHMILDPSHPSYADSLAMVDELNGIGGSADHDIDVDEIIPTLSHHHHQGHQHHVLMEVDGDFADGGKMLLQFPSSDMLDQQQAEDSAAGHHNHSDLLANGNATASSLSSSCNNNNNQSNAPPTEAERTKDNLKIKISTRDGKTSLSKVGRSSSRDEEDGGQGSGGARRSSSSSSSKDKKSSSSSSSGDKASSSSSKDRRSSSSKSSSSSSGHHKSSSSASSSSKRSSSSSKGSSSSSRDKERGSSHKSSSSKSTSSSSSRDRPRERDVAQAEKEAQADKDKDTLAKVMGQSAMEKIGKIPKKVRPAEEAQQTNAPPAKKPSISIEVRKDPENRPKTVKTFNSQFRNHGLVEDIPPPPSRKTLKKPATTTTMAATPATTSISKSIPSSPSTITAPSLKRSSPPKEEVPASSPVSEKRLKLEQLVAAVPADGEEKQGGIKLIAPRSKPTLIESDMFMDALCSSATTGTKSNPKKRKRRTSSSKDGSPPPPESPKIVSAPLKFYQDTLEDATEEKAEGGSPKADEAKKDDGETPSSPTAADDEDKSAASPTKSSQEDEDPSSPAKEIEDEEMDLEEDTTPKPPGPGCGPNGPPGVLVLHRRRRPKKSVRWRPQEALEEVRLFELDETERVNVTKTFMDMMQIERFGERDAFQMGARKLQSDDVMVEQTPWTQLIEVDDVTPTPEGSQSKEKEIQVKREQTVLQALYFNFAMIPDSAAEPDPEILKYTEPAVIPLVDGQNTVNDFTKQGWPEPKELGGGMGGLPFNGGPGFAGDGFPGQFGLPPFGGNPPGIWGPGGPQFGGPNGMPPFGAHMGDEQIKMAMGRLAFPGQQFNAPNFNGINMMNLPAMGAGGGPPGGGWGFRGPPPQGAPWRGNGPPPPVGMMMGNNGGPGRGNWMNNPRICKGFKKGYCKRGDKCNFLHPTGPPPGAFNRM